MKILNGKIAVQFDANHNQEFETPSGIKLYRADSWEHKEGTEDQRRLVTSNVNKIDSNPQIATVIHEGIDGFYKKGDKIFTHYMAYELKEELYGEEGVDVIDEELIIFKLEEDKISLKDGHYLGEQVIETIISQSGLILSAVEKKKALSVKITHKPVKMSEIELNDVVLSIDDFNYQFDYNGKKYIFLREEEIVAKMI